jgi:PhnB protein
MNAILSEESTKTSNANNENQICVLLEDWAEAHRIKDADRIASLCTEDMLQFMLAPPLQYKGANAFDRKAWFASFEGYIGYEAHEPKILAGDDIAFCHFLNRLSATAVAGAKFSMWNRVTFGLRKLDGRWLIAHLHSSVPFYMDGGFKAAVDLHP